MAATHFALPPAFAAQLTRPLDAALEELLPAARPARTAPSAVGSAVSSGTGLNNMASPFLNALQSMPDTATWNGALAHADTGEPLLDLFNGLSAYTEPEEVFTLLDGAWAVDPDV
jgi:hypothetical protein